MEKGVVFMEKLWTPKNVYLDLLKGSHFIDFMIWNFISKFCHVQTQLIF